ncbi:MAG TPA: 3-hydroxyacyl-CoA dehydrogenase NAD-binding domain-containing protein [Bacteroidota bacterium]|nr:3-hydroxyacyl-CoA dehydrogenase NAD-binding domain-containing protein [Bacteroidota bacterium]
MKKFGVVGAGTMGAGIAQSAALAGMHVILCDISEEILRRAHRLMSDDLGKAVGKSILSQQESLDALARITASTSLESLRESDIVVEAVVEELAVKKDLFSRLEEICSDSTIFASNTSSLSITALASGLRYPSRVVGMHFFNPAHRMKLVEVIGGSQSSEETLSRTLELARLLGKSPVLVKDTPGFIVNRVARPFYGEALRLLGEGIATIEDIDMIVKEEGGFKMGPFELMDLIGIDINFAVTKSMYEQTFGEPRYRPHAIQQAMVNAVKLGKKTGKGFYNYDR